MEMGDVLPGNAAGHLSRDGRGTDTPDMAPIVTVTPSAQSLSDALGVILEAQKDPAIADTSLPPASDSQSISAWMGYTRPDLRVIHVDEQPCGVLTLRPAGDGVLDVDVYLVPDARGFGIAADAVRQVADGLPSDVRLQATVRPGQVGAIRCLVRSGWTVVDDSGDRVQYEFPRQTSA